MEVSERKRILLSAMITIEDKLCTLRHCDYDGVKSFREREEEILTLREHLKWLNRAMRLLIEEEVKKSA